MGIQNREYMGRRPDDDDPPRGSAPGEVNIVEAFFMRVFRKHPKFFAYLGLGVLLLTLAAVLVVKLTSGSR